MTTLIIYSEKQQTCKNWSDILHRSPISLAHCLPTIICVMKMIVYIYDLAFMFP